MNNKHANNVNLLFSPNAALSTDDLFYYPFFAGASPVCANENGAAPGQMAGANSIVSQFN
jgi:hypothetical protein